MCNHQPFTCIRVIFIIEAIILLLGLKIWYTIYIGDIHTYTVNRSLPDVTAIAL